jgi:hypothetical protein
VRSHQGPSAAQASLSCHDDTTTPANRPSHLRPAHLRGPSGPRPSAASGPQNIPFPPSCHAHDSRCTITGNRARGVLVLRARPVDGNQSTFPRQEGTHKELGRSIRSCSTIPQSPAAARRIPCLRFKVGSQAFSESYCISGSPRNREAPRYPFRLPPRGHGCVWFDVLHRAAYYRSRGRHSH